MISTVMLELLYVRAIRKYFAKERFDLVLYSTPPITFCKAVEYVKKRDRAKTYLQLKDIFPQNAMDFEMMDKDGIKGGIAILGQTAERLENIRLSGGFGTGYFYENGLLG